MIIGPAIVKNDSSVQFQSNVLKKIRVGTCRQSAFNAQEKISSERFCFLVNIQSDIRGCENVYLFLCYCLQLSSAPICMELVRISLSSSTKRRIKHSEWACNVFRDSVELYAKSIRRNSFGDSKGQVDGISDKKI